MNQSILLAVAVVPPLLFLFYILYMDRREPEPLGRIFALLALGGLSCFPAALVEQIFLAMPVFQLPGVVGAALKSFLVIGPVEELCKILVVFILAWKSPDFNEENDGIVYAGSAALGFALLENIFYVISHGFGVGIMRAVTSIPLHTFTGVVMGYYLGLAKFPPAGRNPRGLLVKGFILAWFAHGLYDTIALAGNYIALLIVPMVIVLSVLGFGYLKKGRRNSLKRWDGVDVVRPSPAERYRPDELETDPDGTVYLKPRRGFWKIVIGRTLFSLSGLFWLLLILGVTDKDRHGDYPVSDAILGGVIITLLPVFIAFLLELSYQKRRKRIRLG